MAKTYSLTQIKTALQNIDSLRAVEEGFAAYSEGKVVVPPVGELQFERPPGDVHIKYGYIKDDEYYVIKIASGFYENDKLGLPTGTGLMLVFSQKSGELECILLDEAYLTNVRTAAAGAVVAKYLAPKDIHRIGIFGAGTQGRMQLEYLKPVTDCRDAIVWGLNPEELDAYKNEMEPLGFNVQTTQSAEEIAASSNLIVTATPSKSPLLNAEQIRKGTHITAMGSDTPEKIELDPEILRDADLVVADSISQCQSRGEISVALKKGLIDNKDLVELGKIIKDEMLGRSSDDQTTVADLTGVAVQDIQIAKAVYKVLAKE